MITRTLIASAAALFASGVLAQSPAWVGTWAASPLPPRAAAGPFAATPDFENQTIRQFVRISTGGSRLRLRLTNEYGTTPLRLGAVSIARVDDSGGIRPETVEAVTFSGESATTIPAGAPMLSDALEFATSDLETLAISLFVPEGTGPCTCHQAGMQTALVSAPGDFTDRAFEPADTIQERAFLSGVEVSANGPAKAIVLLGDSITDGVGSTVDANARWPDKLAERLLARDDGTSWGIANAGISGNRILSDGAGESALARFDRDVLAVPGATHVVVFEGINDLGFEFGIRGGPLQDAVAGLPVSTVTTESMIAGYRQLIARARSKGLTVIGATITPYEGATYYDPRGEEIRQEINAWIRESGEFDAVLDFDAVLRDSDNPERMAEPLHAGDFLHGSDAGYRALAGSIDLSLFD